MLPAARARRETWTRSWTRSTCSGFEEAAEETGIDVREMLLSIASGEETWELSDVLARLRDAFFEEFRRAAALVAALLAPALFSAIARQLAGEGRGAGAVSQLCCLACAAQLIAVVHAPDGGGGGAHRRASPALPTACFPCWPRCLSLAGATASAAMVTPLSALAGNAFSRVLADVGLKLCTIAAALAAAGQLSPRLRLDRLFHLVRSVVNWGGGRFDDRLSRPFGGARAP